MRTDDNGVVLFSANDIPDDRQNTLQAAGSMLAGANWQIGKEIRELREELDAEKVTYSAMSLYDAAGEWAGCSGDHARKCFFVEAHTPKKFQRHDWVTWSQCRVLTSHCELVKDWDEKLLQWELHAEKFNINKISYNGLLSFLGMKAGGDPAELYMHKKIVRTAYKLAASTEIPTGMRLRYQGLIQALTQEAIAANLPDWNPKNILRDKHGTS